jgi:hypothetical protein
MYSIAHAQGRRLNFLYSEAGGGTMLADVSESLRNNAAPVAAPAKTI